MSKSRDLGEFPAAALDIDASGNLDVTGTVTADGLVVDGLLDFGSGTNTGQLGAESGGVSVTAAGKWRVRTNGGTTRQTIESNGDISFYEDTGTTSKFFWDASAENLSLDSTGAYPLTISRNSGTDSNTSIRFKQLSSSWYAGTDGSNNFGIGTTADIGVAPFKITSGGNLYLSGDVITGGGGTGATGEIQFVADSTRARIVGGYNSGGGGYLAFRTDTSGGTDLERMRIAANGSVALGPNLTATPNTTSFLDIRGGRTIQIGKNSINNYYGSSIYMSVDVGSTERAWNFGTRYTGTDASALVFEVSSNANAGRSGDVSGLNYVEKMRISSSGSTAITADSPSDWATTIQNGTGTNAHGLYVNSPSSSGVPFRVDGGGSERMRIQANGVLMVGTSTQGGVNGWSLYPAGSGAAPLQVFNKSNTNSTIAVSFEVNSSVVGQITYLSTGTNYTSISDERLKENITDADDAGSLVDSIQVRKFNWKVDGSSQDYGVIAQELVKVAPVAVSVPENPEDMLGVDYAKLVPMLIKEVQSLRARVAALESI